MISALDLFSIGIGPSSSHTVGPMRAAHRFVAALEEDGVLPDTDRVIVELFASLAATGRGHGTDRAVILGLMGAVPETIDPDTAAIAVDGVVTEGSIALGSRVSIAFDAETDIVMSPRRRLPRHPNALTFTAFDVTGDALAERTYYSVGGGFVMDDDDEAVPVPVASVPLPFASTAELLGHCAREGIAISEVVRRNEHALTEGIDLDARLTGVWRAMSDCIDSGVSRSDDVLPGGLHVKRRAPALHRALREQSGSDPLVAMEWVNLFALAVNEENASGGRVVTAPTNGAAGIIPAVLRFHLDFGRAVHPDDAVRFLLTASAVGMIIKANASISGAEVGCQGEVGSACAMAAAGLTEVLGGTPAQVENAAEIALEHNLGLTCDPIAGLVQIPCIERNAIASVKAINAARLALRGDGTHRVSLDEAIATLRSTGADMKTKYKETSRGGLAVNVVDC